VAYRPRPYGVGPYGVDLYSLYDQPDLSAPYRWRPYGKGNYDDDLYSQYRQKQMAAPDPMEGRSETLQGVLRRETTFASSLQARSSARAFANQNAIVHVGILTGRSLSQANIRLYWEENDPCDTTWITRPPPPFVCPELEPVDG